MKITAISAALLLSACTVGPDYAPPATAEIPAQWTGAQAPTVHASAQAADLTAWWNRFDDAILNGLIGRAVRTNADIDQATAKLREARATLGQQEAGQYPTLDGSASATRQQQTLSSIGGTGPAGGIGGTGPAGGIGGTGPASDHIITNNFQAGFDASFELDLFGGTRRSIESAIAGAQAAEADLGDTILTLLGDVARYYVQAREYQARLAVARETLASRRDTVSLTEAKARAGTGTFLDAVKAQANMEDAAATLPPLEDSFYQAVHRLAVLTGEPPQNILSLMTDPQPIPRLTDRIDLDPPVAALARRPDIQAAERRIAAATADIGVAEADRLPAVTLAGSIGLNARRLNSLTRLSSNVWSFGPEVTIPLFDAGKRAAVVREKIALRDQKIAAWQSTVRTAIEDVENALTSLDREQAHNVALRRTVDAYADALQVATAQYQAGLAAYLDVLDAQRSLSSARDNLVQSEAALATDAIALFKALGGGWGDISLDQVRASDVEGIASVIK
jgi:NodT family efflux transporter outer membrane factor (OMF) lipoprotein